MGTDHAGNKKWTGLKGPVGGLFSPRGAKRESVSTGSRKGEDPVVVNVSGATASTDYLTEPDESPQNGKTNIFGRLRRQEDDVTLTPGQASGKAKRRPSGPMNMLRKAMFMQNSKEDNSITTEASRDTRGIADAFGIDPLFDDELTSSRQSSVKPPSCSDLSSSAEAYSSRTDMSGMSAKMSPVKKGIEKKSDAKSQRPPRPSGPGEKVVGSTLTNDRNATSNSKAQNAQSANNTAKGGQETTNTDSGRNTAPRSPRPMRTGVRNSLVSSLLNPSASNDDGTDASFQPTLSQKLKIGKQEIEKKIEERKKPPIDPLKLIPPTKTQERRVAGAKVTSKKTTSSTSKSTGTRRKSTDSDAVRTAKEASEFIPESPKRPTTPTALQHQRLSPRDHSKGSSQHSRPRRARQSRETTEERRRHNSDGTSRSRGRSGPRHTYEQSPKTPSHHSTKERKYSHHRSRHDESSSELPKISNLDESPSRTRRGSTKSPLHEHRHEREGDTKRHGRSQDARHHAGRREERRAMAEKEERKRSKSLDESLSRDKSIKEDRPDSNDHADHQETDRSHSSGHHRQRDHSSPHSRDSHRTRTEKSPTTLERKRSKSMDDSQSRSKSPHYQARRSSYDSQNRSHSSGHHRHRGESSPHSRDSHRTRTEKSPTTLERKRSKSMEDSESRSKSPHYQARRSSYDSQNRSHSSGHRGQRGDSSPHSPESHRRRTENSPTGEERKRSKSMDESQSQSKSTHQQSRRPSYGSRHRNHDKEDESARSRSRSRDASPHRNELQSPTLAVRKRSLSLDESLSNRRSHHGTGNDNLDAEQEDKVNTMNELWHELTKYGPPHLKKQETERSQKVVSKAEKERRDELGKTARRTATSRHSRSPGRYSSNSYTDDDGTVTSGGTLSRRQTRRERRERGDDTSSSRASQQSTSPSRRSTSSSHRQTPQTPSGRSERSGTRSTSRDKWEKMLHRDDTKTDAVEPPFPTAVSTDESEEKASSSPLSVSQDESDLRASKPTRSNIEISPQDGTNSHSPTTDTTGPAASIPPPTLDSEGESYDKIPPSTILTPGHYEAVNKMAKRTFHSPLGDPPGMYSPTQRQGNGRTRLLSQSSSSSTTATMEAIPPMEEESGKITTSPTTNQDDENNNGDALLSPTSRAAKLKNHLRKLEQQHGSLNSSNRSRSEPPSPGASSRYPRRERPNDDRRSGSGSGSSSKPPTNTSSRQSSTGSSKSRTRDRTESGDQERRPRNLIPHSDNSPGHGSQDLNTATTTSGKASPTKDLGRFLKSPKAENEEETKRKGAARANMSLDSVPVSESTTES